MILQSLYQYYQRLLSDPDSQIALPGYSKVKVDFALNISRDGQLLNILDLRTKAGKKLVGLETDVPEQAKRTSGKSANYLCDNSKYVLGIGLNKDSNEVEIASNYFMEFKKKNLEIIADNHDLGLEALRKFLNQWNPENAIANQLILSVKEDLLKSSNIVFRLDGEYRNINDRAEAKIAWQQYQQRAGLKDGFTGQCLITGEISPLAQLHPSFKGVRGAQSSGASLVSFNQPSFTSFDKVQSYNSPVSKEAAFAYGTALTHLLRYGSKQRIQLGDSTTVFWAERKTSAEDMLLDLLCMDNVSESDANDNNPAEEEPVNDPQTSQKLFHILERLRQGKPIHEFADWDPDIQFYILGLSPNSGRISVRFWHMNTLGTLLDRIGQHYRDLEIQKQYVTESDFIPAWMILKETAVLGKSENISPLMSGALMRSILDGYPYPQGLYTAIISRIRADQKVNTNRAAIIKACLIRQARRNQKTIEETTMALNETSTSVPYRLGRLFALLEKAQEDANPGINSTIRDRYFGAASATPRSVFPILIRLAQHHISKAEYGYATDNRIKEVLNEIDQFPAHLNLEDQGLFILGYYHQRNALYTKKEKTEKE